MKQFYLFTYILFWSLSHGYAVDFLMNTSSNTVDCSTSHNFYDSGGFASDYNDNESFTMTFSPDLAGHFINIVFSSFNLALGDELSFYNGASTSDPLIGIYSEDVNLGTIAASNASGAITVVFTSDNSTNRDGWAAIINCTSFPVYTNVAVMTDGVNFVSCNANFYDQGGINNNYLDNQNQTMTFYPVNAGEFVNITFSSFDLSNGDELSFYDGTSTSATLLGTFIGEASPGTVAATNANGAITVVFRSDASGTNGGWTATISCSTTPLFSTVALMTDGAEFTSCNAVFYDQGGINDDYLDNQDQTMTFFPQEVGQFVSMLFSSFNLHLEDGLSIYDGRSTSAPLIGTYSQNVNPGIVSASNDDGALTVNFTSDGDFNRDGWTANISCATSPLNSTVAVMTDGAEFTSCNAVFYDQGGINNDYLDNQNQTMTFLPSGFGQAVSMIFSSFNLRSGDELSFYNGTSTSDPLIGTFSNTSPGTITANNPAGALTAVFTSDGNFNRDGWVANITCITNPLPINLINFQIQEKNRFVEVSWGTASEINNDFFLIEKSKDLNHWDKVGQVEGAGHSSQTLFYTFLDKKPFSGISYYRLKQVDFDGLATYSQIQAINRGEKEDQEIFLYPNPIDRYLFLSGDSSELSQIQIYNTLGQEISHLAKVFNSQENIFTIDFINLLSGTYFIKIGLNRYKIYKR